MQGKIIDFSRGMNGKQRITLELDGDIRELYEELKDSDVDITIKKHHDKRSIDANAYAWILIGKLAAKLQITPNEVYRQYIPDVADNYVIQPVKEDMLERWDKIWCEKHVGRMTDDLGECKRTPGYHNIRCYLGSSDYDSAQMYRLTQLIVEDCKEQNIETMTPDELARLLEGRK